MSALEHLHPDQFRNEVNEYWAAHVRPYEGKYLIVHHGELSGLVTAHRVNPDRLVAPPPQDQRGRSLYGRQYDKETDKALPSPRRVGFLNYETYPSMTFGVPGEPPAQRIWKVFVSGPHRRKGVASAMLDVAREFDGPVQHAGWTLLSEDGAAFAKGKP